MAHLKAQATAEPLGPGHRYANVLLGLRKTDALSLAAAVRRGFTYRVLDRFARETDLPLSALGELIHIPSRTLVRRKTEGRLQPEESDRLLRASRIFGLAIDLFEGDRIAALQWLSNAQRALGGQTPMDLLQTDVGAREVENLIGRVEHGVAV
jgi:putative toxin-antitoxin system antitoxin component (TIGR02293 family)